MSLPAWKRSAERFLVLLLSILAGAITAAAEKPFSRLWWLTDSHTQVPVNDILREPGGALWLATDLGVYRFTGTGFVRMRDSGGAVTCLYRSAEGLLAGYRSGRIARISEDSARTIAMPGGGPGTAVTGFACWGDVIAFSTLGEGIWGLRQGRVARFGSSQGLSDDYVYGLHIAGPGQLLAATDRGLNAIRATGGKLHVERVLQDGIVQTLRAVPGRPAEVLVGTNEGLFYCIRFSGAGWRILVKDSLPAPVQDLALQNGKILALAANAKTYVYKQETAGSFYRRDSFLLDEQGTRLYADAAGMLWYGCNAGLRALTYGFVNQVAPAPVYRLHEISAMTADKGVVWYGQSDVLIGLRPDGSSRKYRMPAQITCLGSDSSGIWIGTLGRGLLHLDKSGALGTPAGAEAFSREHVLSLTLHRDRLWMATLSGLDEFERSREALRDIRHHSKHAGLGADYVYQCMPDRRGRIWIATDGAGICCYASGKYRRWSEGQDGFRGRTVYSITEDGAGNIWAATLEHGICRFDGKRWSSVGREDGLQSLNVSSLATLRDGQVLIVHEQGMDLYQPSASAFRHIGRRQGMSIDSSSRTLNCVALDTSGAVLAPFEDGFLRFLPGDSAAAMPGLRILQAAAPGQSAGVIKQIFGPEENTLSFRFEGANPLNAERLFYRYRLAGFMKDWILTRDESANFARLPAGDYVFELQAAYSAAFHEPAILRFAFHIGRPLWQRWWAIALAVGLLIIGGLMIIRFRERNIRRIEQLQNARIQMEYEHLKSQINPHFLFNSLNILGTLIPRDPARAVDYTYALSDLYRNTLHYRDRELISLEEEWGILMQYLLVQKTRFGEALQLCSDIPEALMRKARVVPLALQLLVENAIKHNVVSTAAPLTISIVVVDGKLKVSNPARPKRNPEKGTGIGLANIRSRYGLHKQDIRYGLTDDDTFTVELPLL